MCSWAEFKVASRAYSPVFHPLFFCPSTLFFHCSLMPDNVRSLFDTSRRQPNGPLHVSQDDVLGKLCQSQPCFIRPIYQRRATPTDTLHSNMTGRGPKRTHFAPVLQAVPYSVVGEESLDLRLRPNLNTWSHLACGTTPASEMSDMQADREVSTLSIAYQCHEHLSSSLLSFIFCMPWLL